jgi:hypothetical protein
MDINTDAVTISLWVKLANLPSEMPVPYGPFFDSKSDAYVLYADRGNGEFRFKVTTDAGAERPGISESDLVVGKWLHIVGVYDGSTARIYLNGELKDSHNLTGTVNPGQVTLIGLNGNDHVQSAMDNFQLFNRALSEDEIALIYNETKLFALHRK